MLFKPSAYIAFVLVLVSGSLAQPRLAPIPRSLPAPALPTGFEPEAGNAVVFPLPHASGYSVSVEPGEMRLSFARDEGNAAPEVVRIKLGGASKRHRAQF